MKAISGPAPAVSTYVHRSPSRNLQHEHDDVVKAHKVEQGKALHELKEHVQLIKCMLIPPSELGWHGAATRLSSSEANAPSAQKK